MTAQPVPAAADTSTTAGSTNATTQAPRPAAIGRRTAVVCLVVGAVLNLTEAIIGRLVGGGDSVAAGFEAWAARSTLTAAAGIAGTVAVPFLLLAIVAMAQLIRPRMPRLGGAVTFLGYIGGMGFFGLHAIMIVQYVALDQPDREAMVALMESAQASPMALLVVAPFMIGLPLGALLAAVGFFRTRVVPLWIPVVLALFIVLDFGPFSTGPVDPHWLFLAASLGVAYTVAKLTDREWWTGRVTEKETH